MGVSVEYAPKITGTNEAGEPVYTGDMSEVQTDSPKIKLTVHKDTPQDVALFGEFAGEVKAVVDRFRPDPVEPTEPGDSYIDLEVEPGRISHSGPAGPELVEVMLALPEGKTLAAADSYTLTVQANVAGSGIFELRLVGNDQRYSFDHEGGGGPSERSLTVTELPESVQLEIRSSGGVQPTNTIHVTGISARIEANTTEAD